MNCPFNKKFIVSCLAAVCVSSTIPAVAQRQGISSLEEVIVSARRRDESLQDVPISVNVVSEEALKELNIRRFEDLQEVVAGLELEDRAVGPLASMRGVRFDAFASGNNPSVEFYLNDVLIASNVAMQSMFDVGRIEVLRGPQGTLRGRASPSGSITMTSTRPSLEGITGNADVTTTGEGGENYNGGVSFPIIKEMLGVRFAGFSEKNRINHVESFRTGDRAKMESDGYRVSLLFEPTDNFTINAYYQELSTDRWQYSQLESANIVDPTLPDSPVHIEDDDLLSGQSAATTNFTDMERTGLEVEWNVGPVQINYSGALTDTEFDNTTVGDTVGFYDESYPEELQGFINQAVNNVIEAETHEVRFMGDAADSLGYVAGVFYSEFASANDILAFTPVFGTGIEPDDFYRMFETPVISIGNSREISYFGNLTYRFTDDTELSAGLRYIDYESEQLTQVIDGDTLADNAEDDQNVIYTVSFAHNFTDNLMGYVTLGTSWRPSNERIGNTDTERTKREQQFLSTDPEESESIEFGWKSVSLDNRLTLNGAIFYQQFDNYPDLGSGGGVRYVETDIEGLETVAADTFLAPLDVDVYGLELDGSYQITDRLNVSGNYSWAQGTQEGEIACNDYAPVDGKPDSVTAPVTIEQIRAATGGDDIAACNISQRSYEGPTWSASLRAEYSQPVFDGLNGYIRLHTKINGDSKGSEQNPNDDVSSYATLNFYTGLRSGESNWGRWEVMAFVKNVTDTQKRLNYGSFPLTTSIRTFTGTTNVQSPYRSVSLTPPREVGLTVRFDF